MIKLEITIAEELHNKLEIASQRAAKTIDQYVQELLTQISGNLSVTPTASEALLAESYQIMAKDNAKLVKDALPAQYLAFTNSGEDGHGPHPAR